jgi:putative ABC transport system permease protein
MTPLRLALSNLRHKLARTLIAVAGVTFAVVLIFMEIGMFGGIKRTATMLYDGLQFDLLVASKEYIDLSRPGEVSRARVVQARSVEGVADVTPLSVGFGGWRQPSATGTFGGFQPPGAVQSIYIVAVPPSRLLDTFTVGERRVFKSEEHARRSGIELSRLDTFLIDEMSSSSLGNYEQLRDIPPDGRPVGNAGDRDAVRLNERRAEVVGTFRVGTGFSWNGMLMCSEETFRRFTRRPDDLVNFALVRISDGADRARVKERLEAKLPPDVQVFTVEEIKDKEQSFWVDITSVGQFIQVAVVLAIVVGVIFVYQMMAADIRNMLPEYATVKALGYRPSYLTQVVLWQAILLALFGYLPGLVVSFGLFWVAKTHGGIPTVMTFETALLVLALTCTMCLVSGALAVRKVHSADPADLF